jgi:hypothetical protein
MRIIESVLPDDRITRSTSESIGHKILVLAWGLQSSKSDIQELSLSELADLTGKTRALFSHYAKEWEAMFGIHFRGMKGQETSEVFRESANRGWKKRHAKPGSKRNAENYKSRMIEKLKLRAA